MNEFVVCGWYTPDYKVWADRLLSNLTALGLPHDFVVVPKPIAEWESITLLKPQQVLAAMDRNPGKTIIFLDVDCEVLSASAMVSLSEIIGDVGFYLRTKFRRSGALKWSPRSGTMVFKPSLNARKFVEMWRDLSVSAPAYAVDQDMLAITLGKHPWSITFIDIRHCAIEGDKVSDPWILHYSASENVHKASHVKRWAVRQFYS